MKIAPRAVAIKSDTSSCGIQLQLLGQGRPRKGERTQDEKNQPGSKGGPGISKNHAAANYVT
jgi:hypothetical protein